MSTTEDILRVIDATRAAKTQLKLLETALEQSVRAVTVARRELQMAELAEQTVRLGDFKRSPS